MAKKFVVKLKSGIDVKEYRCKPRNALASVTSEVDLADGVVFKTDDGKYVVVSQNVATVYDTYEALPDDVKQQKAKTEI